MKRLLCLVTVIAVMLSMAACAEEAKTTVKIASLKGPTSMGLVSLMHEENTENDYEFSVEATADAITPQLIRGEIDIAMVPCNLASILYAKTEGAVEIAAVNTLGVLYILENGETVQSINDLKGKTICSTGQGTTPEFALNYILSKNGINPETDLTIEFKSEAAEVASAMLENEAVLAVLPQPYVTGVLTQNDGVRVALSLTDEWDKVGDGSALITGVALVRRDFADNNPDAVKAFLNEYAKSTEFVNANPAEASVWIEELEIVAKAKIAEMAIPQCNIVCITGEEMKTKVSGYLEALYEQNAESVGGNIPGEDFYLTY